jgi:cytochrome c biogenesis protein CcmG/thiol:disulfide interchange protein DsbE
MKMKNVGVIVLTVLALIGLTYYADKKTRVSNNVAGASRTDYSGDKSIGFPAPVVHFKDLEGKDTSLGDYNGKVVLVNFWATWCDPCREEIPWLIDMQRKYADKGFTVLGIAMDEEGKKVVAPYVSNEHFDVNSQKLTMNYPIVIGNDDIAEKFGGLLGYPTSVLISRDGKQVKRITGIISEAEMSHAIESLL